MSANFWTGFLRHVAKFSVRYKLFLLLAGIGLAASGFAESPSAGLTAIGTAILASIFASFFLEIFPSDSLDNRIRASGLSDIFLPAKAFDEERWFVLLEETTQHVDISGRSLYKWINSDNKRRRFSEIVRTKTERGVNFRILLMSRDNSFLAALEEEKKALHTSLIPKLEEIERFFVELSKLIPQDQGLRFEVRSNYSLPFYRSITRLDSTIYTIPYFDDRETGECPLMEISDQRKPLFKLHKESCVDYWNDKRSRRLCGGVREVERPHAFEDDLIQFQQKKHFSVMTRLRTESVYCFDDFDEGWEYLFNRLGSPGTTPKLLCDFTVASAAKSNFKGYGFVTYPARAARFAVRFGISVKAIMALDTDNDDCLRQSEVYLYDFLRHFFSDASDLRTLLSLSCRDDSKFRFIVIPSKAVQAGYCSPFNVYGDMAVSRSIIAGPDISPCLRASWRADEIEGFKQEFNRLWDEYSFVQEALAEKASASPDGQLFKSVDFGSTRDFVGEGL